MCTPIWQRDSKTRRMMIIGNLSLVVGLLLWNFVTPRTAMSSGRGSTQCAAHCSAFRSQLTFADSALPGAAAKSKFDASLCSRFKR
jgi:hypothetical protein